MALPTIAFVSITVFALIRFIPGDPAALMLGDMAPVSYTHLTLPTTPYV